MFKLLTFISLILTVVSSQNCGNNIGNCPTGQCCSRYNWCGTGDGWCSFGCQSAFGSCSLPTVVSPETNIKVVSSCTVPNTVAITFDDGPFTFTRSILDQFNAVGAKVTFFVNGLNWNCIYDHAETLKSAFDSGHQIGSHTWSHVDMQQLSDADLSADMNKLSTSLQKIIGAVPTYVRPPYGSYNAQNVNVMQSLGFTKFVMWDVDSGDTAGLTPAQQQERYNMANTTVSHNVLQHETYQTTSSEMVPFIIKWAQSRNLSMVTVGECLGDPVQNWYKDPVAAESRNPTWTC